MRSAWGWEQGKRERGRRVEIHNLQPHRADARRDMHLVRAVGPREVFPGIHIPVTLATYINVIFHI
jgi:hypothetical protein